MKIWRVAAVMALVSGPAYAQMPNLNLMPEVHSKTPEEKAADEIRDKAYRESLRKIPDAKVSSDPWGSVRGPDTAKTSTKTSTGTSAKPRTKTAN
ncbi:MAG: hypothetical protein ACREC2_14200 [Bradyrhizobium sp.]